MKYLFRLIVVVACLSLLAFTAGGALARPADAPGTDAFVHFQTVETGSVGGYVDMFLILDLPAATSLGAATIQISYDPNTGLLGNCEPDPNNVFDTRMCNKTAAGTPFSKPVTLNVTSIAGVSGQLTIAKMPFQLLGQPGEGITLAISVQTLADSDGHTIPHYSTDGLIKIAPGSNPPTAQDFQKSAYSALPVTFSASDFSSHFSGNLEKIQLIAMPLHGKIRVDGVETWAGQKIFYADLGKITYISDVGYQGPDSFTWNGYNGATYAAQGAMVGLSVGPTLSDLYLPVIVSP